MIQNNELVMLHKQIKESARTTEKSITVTFEKVKNIIINGNCLTSLQNLTRQVETEKHSLVHLKQNVTSVLNNLHQRDRVILEHLNVISVLVKKLYLLHNVLQKMDEFTKVSVSFIHTFNFTF